MFDGVSDDDESYHIRDQRYLKKKSLPADVHLPNKNEAKLLRRLMSETGLSEVELRTHYKYRRMLSEARKKEGSKSQFERDINSILKDVTRELKLPKSHPKVVEKFVEKINQIKNGDYDTYWRYRSLRLTYMSTNNILHKLKMT